MKASDALAILSDEQSGNKPVVFFCAEICSGQTQQGLHIFFVFRFNVKVICTGQKVGNYGSESS